MAYSGINMDKMIVDAYCTPGTERDTRLAPTELLRQMEAAGISKAIVVPQDRELAVLNRDGNERILHLAAEHPDRLIPACGINPWYGDESVEELQRSAEAGARMLVLAPHLQGFLPADEMVMDLLMAAAEFGLPIYFHTGPHNSGSPAQVVLVANQHPNAKFIMGHCGSTDHAWDMPAVLREHRLDNLWFELSYVRPWAAASYVQIAGSTRFIWGSGSPRNSLAFELQQLNQHLPISEYPDVYGRNLTHLLGEAQDD